LGAAGREGKGTVRTGLEWSGEMMQEGSRRIGEERNGNAGVEQVGGMRNGKEG